MAKQPRGSVSRIRDRWRTQIRTIDGRRISADEILGRKARTYATEEDARAAVDVALDVLSGREDSAVIGRLQLHSTRHDLLAAREQIIAAQRATADALDAVDTAIARFDELTRAPGV